MYSKNYLIIWNGNLETEGVLYKLYIEYRASGFREEMLASTGDPAVPEPRKKLLQVASITIVC